MKKLLIVFFMLLSLAGCNEYPHEMTKEDRELVNLVDIDRSPEGEYSVF